MRRLNIFGIISPLFILWALLAMEARSEAPPRAADPAQADASFHADHAESGAAFISSSDPLDLIIAKLVKLGEVNQEAGQLIQDRAKDQSLKEFGLRLRQDNQLLNSRLRDFSDQQALVLVGDDIKSPTLSAFTDKLKALQTSANFDREIISLHAANSAEILRCLRLLKEQTPIRPLSELLTHHTAILGQHSKLAQSFDQVSVSKERL